MNNMHSSSSEDTPIFSKSTPYLSKIQERILLSKPDSLKKTYHLSLKKDPHLIFHPGDSVGIFPENSPSQIALFLEAFSQPNSADNQFKLAKKNLSLITQKALDALLPSFSEETLSEIKKNQESIDFYLKTHDYISFFNRYRLVRPIDFEQLVSLLNPIVPRFYSIASDPLTHPNELHLLVSTFLYPVQDRLVPGIGSSFLCEYSHIEKTPIPLFPFKSPALRLPSDETPIIMIGPGTGVAPFKSFIEARVRLGHKKNWLFFGEKEQAHDFYYQNQFLDYEKNQFLKLTTAFSRDQKEKIYVQHRLKEHQKDLYRWIEEGAIVYICGDAKKMAKDVETQLIELFKEEKNLSFLEAEAIFKSLRQSKRIVFEVY